MYALLGYAKGWVSGLLAGLVSLQAATSSTSDGGAHITQAEGITAAVAALVAGGAVAAIPNKAKAPAVTEDELALGDGAQDDEL